MSTSIKKAERKEDEPTVLQKMDILAPSVDLLLKKEKTQRSMTGGLMSMLTVSIFIVLMSIKTVDHFSIEAPSFTQMKRMLGVTPQSDPNANT